MQKFFGFKKRKRSVFLRNKRQRKRTMSLSRILFVVLFTALAALLSYQYLLSPPDIFPTHQPLTIEEGETLRQIAQKLESQDYIRNANIFQWATMLLQDEPTIIAGSYTFYHKQGTLTLAKRLSNGLFGDPPKTITFPEGFTVEQMARRASETFPAISYEVFAKLAKPREGFLFPDTYEFFSNVEAWEIINTMTENFNRKTKALREENLKKNERNFRDVIIMASILEEEAKTDRSRRIISGILWKRLEIGMPLQVDATFAYDIGKSTYELTFEDLKKPSPYNTYSQKGLPVGPISNPGLESIRAAMNPIETEYLYYLSDRDGNVYYSTTLDEHNVLKEKYVN